MERRHLVYVLPGIGGSVLERRKPGGDFATVVHIHGVADPIGQVPVWVQAYPSDQQGVQPPVAEVRAVWDAHRGAFGCELLGLAPGLYDLVVRARSVPGAGDLLCTDAIGVIEA